MKIIAFLTILLVFITPNDSIANSNTSDMLSHVLDSVVMIISMDENLQPLAIGSGFAIGKKGQIATNYHVVENASSVFVKFANKDKKYDVRTIVHKDPNHDLVVIELTANTNPLALGDDKLCRIGAKVYVAGNPEGLEGTVSQGIISGFRKVGDAFRLMQITAPVSPGSSGGPILTQKGEVIGIASASFISGQNLNFGIPVTQLKKLLKKSPTNEKLSKESVPVCPQVEFPGSVRSSDLVVAKNISVKYRSIMGMGSVSLSVSNKLQKDIRNIKTVLLWYSKDGELLHYNPILIADKVVSGYTKLIHKSLLAGVGDLPYNVTARSRVIDYEILPTSGAMEFK